MRLVISGLVLLGLLALSPNNGVWLPLGDGKITAQAKAGNVFLCPTRLIGGGAERSGDWIRDRLWNPALKPVVEGDVRWPKARVTIGLQGETRVVSANNLPTHPTGLFPIQPSSKAYRYDRNPNFIREQRVLLNLPAHPKIAARPSCLPMGMIGFATTGVAIFNAIDAQGRDAPAHEIQDHCNGHPERNGQYHYHDFSNCIPDLGGKAGRHSDLVGYALDGFGIYGLYEGNGRVMTNADLDECHGHIGKVVWDGQEVKMYHYHLTREYPYTLGCFRGQPVSLPRP